MSRMKNAVLFTLTVFSLVSAFFLPVIAPINAQTVVPTSISIALKPNPVGVGQIVAFEFQVTPAPPTSNDRFVNLSAGILGSGWNFPVSTNATGGATLFYSFNQTGNRVFFVSFPGQSFKNGQVYASSQNEMALVVQAEPVETNLPYPTPNPAPTNSAPTWPISPEFTATLNRATYNVTNYLTGEIQQVDNSFIEFKILNQPLTGGLKSIYYVLGINDPSDGSFREIYEDGTHKIQSNATYTILTLRIGEYSSLPPSMRNYTSIDFTIQAQTNLGKSNWSPIQTVYLTETPSPPPNAAPAATLPPATPTPTPKPTWSPPPRIETNTTSGLTVRMTLAGNVTPSQFSNITLTSESAQAAQLSFMLSGPAGNTGFSNITIPKSAVANAASIVVMIDGQPAQNQGYSQDVNNYYVWFTTHFSSHQISIVFTANSNPDAPAALSEQQTVSFSEIIIGLTAGLVIVGVVTAVLVAVNNQKRRKPSERPQQVAIRGG